ncbi:MAG TPA: hypothetical protein VFR02_03470 [bacterium]|nr:hypothetical protein [bacterium]
MSPLGTPLPVRETPAPYPAPAGRDLVYEVSLKTRAAAPWLSDLPQACRLVQALTQGQLLDQYQIMDFLIWSEGFFLRVRLKAMPALADFLAFLREKTAGPGEGAFAWEDELQWIRLISPEKLSESTRDFLANAEKLREGLKDRPHPSLFFFYRNRPSAQ